MSRILSDLFSSVIAGSMVGIGGIVFLSSSNTLIGSLLFSVGLLSIVMLNLNLFTGKVGHALIVKGVTLKLPMIWTGNLGGIGMVAYLIKRTRVYDSIIDRCNTLVNVRLNDTHESLFILAIFCGLLMYIAVSCFDTERTCSLFLLFLCVVVFINAGFEHCIADMLYFALTGNLFSHLGIILIVTCGNAIGANIIPIMIIIMRYKY